MQNGRSNKTPEYLKYKLINLKLWIQNQYLPYRSKLKQEAKYRHEQEKDFMVTLQAMGLPTSTYSADTALEADDTDIDKYISDEEQDNPITFVDHPTGSPIENGNPLLFIYDCETIGGNHLRDHIMEVGSLVSIPDGVSIHNAEFSSLCYTSQRIVRQGRILFLW